MRVCVCVSCLNDRLKCHSSRSRGDLHPDPYSPLLRFSVRSWRLPLYGISNVPLTNPLSPSKPVMRGATYVRSPCCFLISAGIQTHAVTLLLLLLLSVLLFCMQNLLTTTAEKVWHLLSDIYLASDYSTQGGAITISMHLI